VYPFLDPRHWRLNRFAVSHVCTGWKESLGCLEASGPDGKVGKRETEEAVDRTRECCGTRTCDSCGRSRAQYGSNQAQGSLGCGAGSADGQGAWRVWDVRGQRERHDTELEADVPEAVRPRRGRTYPSRSVRQGRSNSRFALRAVHVRRQREDRAHIIAAEDDPRRWHLCERAYRHKQERRDPWASQQNRNHLDRAACGTCSSDNHSNHPNPANHYHPEVQLLDREHRPQRHNRTLWRLPRRRARPTRLRPHRSPSPRHHRLRARLRAHSLD